MTVKTHLFHYICEESKFSSHAPCQRRIPKGLTAQEQLLLEFVAGFFLIFYL